MWQHAATGIAKDVTTCLGDTLPRKVGKSMPTPVAVGSHGHRQRFPYVSGRRIAPRRRESYAEACGCFTFLGDSLPNQTSWEIYILMAATAHSHKLRPLMSCAPGEIAASQLWASAAWVATLPGGWLVHDCWLRLLVSHASKGNCGARPLASATCAPRAQGDSGSRLWLQP